MDDNQPKNAEEQSLGSPAQESNRHFEHLKNSPPENTSAFSRPKSEDTENSSSIGGSQTSEKQSEEQSEEQSETQSEKQSEELCAPTSESPSEERLEQTAKAVAKKNIFSGLGERLKGWKDFLFDAAKERSKEISHAKAKRIGVAIFFLVFVVGFVAFYFTVGRKIAFFIRDPAGFRQWLTGFGKGSAMIFVLLRAVQTAFKLIPGEALEIAAGCMFGKWWGLVWCLVGGVIGSLIIIFLGKRYGMKIVGLFVSPKKMQSIAFLKNKKRLNAAFFFLYFIPGTPKDMFTWLICLTDENIFLFLLVTTIARIPSVLTSTWCGEALVNENYFLSAVILGVTVAIGVVSWLVYKLVQKYRRHGLSEE